MDSPLTVKELLILQDMCLDAGHRSKQRSAVARATGNFGIAEYEARLQEHYARLRMRFEDEIVESRSAEADRPENPQGTSSVCRPAEPRQAARAS
jgi:hypothetical protein